MIQDNNIDLYLQQIQPRDLAELMRHIQRDYWMLVGSYTSFLELFEQQLPKIDLPQDLFANFDTFMAIGRHTIQNLKDVLDTYPDFEHILVTDPKLAFERRSWVAHDLLQYSGTLKIWGELFQDFLEDGPSTKPANQRAVYFNQAMLATADRMLCIARSCYAFN